MGRHGSVAALPDSRVMIARSDVSGAEKCAGPAPGRHLAVPRQGRCRCASNDGTQHAALAPVGRFENASHQGLPRLFIVFPLLPHTAFRSRHPLAAGAAECPCGTPLTASGPVPRRSVMTVAMRTPGFIGDPNPRRKRSTGVGVGQARAGEMMIVHAVIDCAPFVMATATRAPGRASRSPLHQATRPRT
jgi:hypothetical protein